MSEYRIERDTLGEIKIPQEALWGAQTQRAVENFPISSYTLPWEFLEALALIKRYAAEVNKDLGNIPPKVADAIVQAAEELLENPEKYKKHFPVDVFQTGSGTSTNMNMNEVLANRACEILGGKRGDKSLVHPNDHVNRGMSSNDSIPSALYISVRKKSEKLLEELSLLEKSFEKKEKEFYEVIKIGRTHLQDAVPMRLGQEFSSYKTQMKKAQERIQNIHPFLEELALGGTALGTGINTHPEFAPRVIQKIAERLGIPFKPAENYFEAISSKDAVTEYMGGLATLASALLKIGNDIRLLSSGPRTGFAEVILPSLQPGSSIMPGKVNPVIPEMLIQVCAFVIGKFQSVVIANQNAPLELNIMMPLLAHEVLTSQEVLIHALKTFREKCVEGIQANKKRCEELVERSLALVTPLALKIGYDRAAEIAYKAYKEDKTVREVVEEEGILSKEEIQEILDPRKML